MKRAKKIRDLTRFQSTAALYELEPPHLKDDGEPTRFVIVSSITAHYSGPETYIYESNESGEMVCWEEMRGSCRGTLEHEDALNNMGYELEQG